jgi:hypothetical protein
LHSYSSSDQRFLSSQTQWIEIARKWYHSPINIFVTFVDFKKSSRSGNKCMKNMKRNLPIGKI